MGILDTGVNFLKTLGPVGNIAGTAVTQVKKVTDPLLNVQTNPSVDTSTPTPNTPANFSSPDYGFMSGNISTNTDGIRTPNIPKTTSVQTPTISTPVTPAATANTVSTAATVTPATAVDSTSDKLVLPVETNAKLLARQQALADKRAAANIASATASTAPAPTSLTDPNLLTAKESDIDALKQSTLTSLQSSDLTNKAADRDRTLAAAKANADNENAVIGLNPDGSIDASRPNSIAARNQAQLDEYVKNTNLLNSQYESQRQGQSGSEVRQALLNQGVDISTLTPDAIQRVADTVGAKVMTDIYNAKKQTVDSIYAAKKGTLDKLSTLVEQGRISKEKYNNLVATTSSAYDNTVQQIQTKYANDVLGLSDKAETRRDSQGTANANYIAALKSLPDDVKSHILSTYGNVARTLNTSDFIALVNKDPKVAAGIKQIQDAAARVAGVNIGYKQSQTTLANAKGTAALETAGANLTKAAKYKGGTGGAAQDPNSKQVSPAELSAARALSLNISGVHTKGQLNDLYRNAK